MIPVIDYNSDTILEEIREAYTTVGFAVFQHALNRKDQDAMKQWWDLMRNFFDQEIQIPSREQLRLQYSGCRKCRPNCS